MKKIFMIALTGLALSVSAVSAQTVLKLSHNAAPGNPKAVASDKFAELV